MNVNLFSKIANKLVDSGTIATEDKELYEYGLKQSMNMFFNILTTLVIGFIFGMVWQSLLFMVSYIPLRSYAGGYHARTPLKCYFLSIILVIFVLLSCRFIPPNITLIITMILGASVIIFKFAPLADKNKPLDEVEIKIFKKRIRIILFLEVMMAGLFWALGFAWVMICVTVSMSVASIMVIAGVVRDKISR